MRRVEVVAFVCLLVCPLVSSAANYIVPTTTLAAQTANNTSAANSFRAQSNGNLGAANVSKVDVHTLLYADAQTKVFAHLMLWFGGSNHMNVGYNSTDPAQVQRQIKDMISRGIDGVIIDWYGPDNSIDQATQAVMAEAEKHPGFTFALMVDQGAIALSSCRGCDPQQALTSQMQYVEQKYFTSPAYLTMQGQPVITNFDIDLSYSIDWKGLSASLSSHPAFIFQNNPGFSHILSDGSYSWVMPTTSDYGMSYLSGFYNAGMSLSNEQTVGATYKGFNDSLASWGSNRVMQQKCGQTWLKTFSEINALYNSSKELPYLQLVTWNDYEEGTEIESGIDNCVTISASLSGDNLQWKVGGSESALDHYTTYISADGKNLMALSDTETGNRSLNLCSFSIPSGKYQLFVQAIGKPGMANRITGAIPYTAACTATTSTSPSLAFAASPLSISIPAGQSGTVTVLAQAQSGAFNSPVALTCGTLPSNLTCRFSPAQITPGSGKATSVLTISSAAATGFNRQESPGGLLYATAALPFGVAALAFLGGTQRNRLKQLIGICVLAGAGLMSISCGGKVNGMQATQAGTSSTAGSYSVTINGNASSVQLATSVSVTVQ
ncbi:MAG TPA: endo-1,3-alpha-glucanase family glycosylhydrolase [Candidatus Sulfotelmatobacter sp.]